MNEFYKTYYTKYREADQETRAAAMQHWTRRHVENVEANRADLIIFSGRMLAAIMKADATAAA